MTPEEHYNQQVTAERDQRKQLREAYHVCPLCRKEFVVPLGGGRTCWWECKCGGYSQLCRTWEDALTSQWVVVDPELNARMYPPIGGM